MVSILNSNNENNKWKRYNSCYSKRRVRRLIKNNTDLDIIDMTYIPKSDCSYQLSSDADNFNVSSQNQSDDHIISNLNIVDDNDSLSEQMQL